MTRCLIALGGNIGVSESVFKSAMDLLASPEIQITALSFIRKTTPVGQSAGEEFLNAAATLSCHSGPYELLAALHQIEQAFGRTRTIHWGPRTLDLDLCLFGDTIIDDHQLVVPHPAMWYRKFVLDPALDVAANMVHPLLQRSVGDLHADLQKRPLQIALRCSEKWPIALDLAEIARQLPDDRVNWQIPDQRSDNYSAPSVMSDSVPGTTSTRDASTRNEPQAKTVGDIGSIVPAAPLTSGGQPSPSLFAEVILQKKPADATPRTQPPHAATRTITITTASQNDAVDQVRSLLSAVLG